MHKNRIYIIFGLLLVGFIRSYSNTPDSLLLKYGLSTTEFTIIKVKDAPKNVFRNLSSDAIKQTDTIIIAKIDTFKNMLKIEGRSLNHKLVLSGKVFKEGISFYSSRFKGEVYMNDCVFFNRVNFSSTIFDTTLILWNTKFNKAGVFSNATFHEIEFGETQFEEDVQFNDVKFRGNCYFIETKFKKKALFTNAIFYDFASFNFSEFEQKPWFWNSISTDTLTFYSVKLKAGIDFQSSKFGRLLGLNYLKSDGKIDFSDVSMPTYTDLSSVKTAETIDFNYLHDSTQSTEYKINIYNVDLDKLMLTAQFTLYFDKSLSLDIKNSIYKHLLDNLNSKGYKNVYKSFDIGYKGFMNENYNRFYEKLFYWTNRTWWNFGYDKQKVFLWTIIFILLFSIPVKIWLKLFVDKVYAYEKLSKRYHLNRKVNNPIIRFFYDYWIAFIYTIFVFFNLKLDFERLSFESFLASTFIFTIYVFGLICSAFIVNLIITI